MNSNLIRNHIATIVHNRPYSFTKYVINGLTTLEYDIGKATKDGGCNTYIINPTSIFGDRFLKETKAIIQWFKDNGYTYIDCHGEKETSCWFIIDTKNLSIAKYFIDNDNILPCFVRERLGHVRINFPVLYLTVEQLTKYLFDTFDKEWYNDSNYVYGIDVADSDDSNASSYGFRIVDRNNNIPVTSIDTYGLYSINHPDKTTNTDSLYKVYNPHYP